MSRWMWKVVEDKINEARIIKTERERIKEKKRQREKKKEFKKPTVEKEMKTARIIEEKQEEEKDLIEIKTVEEIVLKRFYKYLKESKRMLMRKTWNYTIDFKEGFVPKKEKIYLSLRIKKKKV